MDTYSPTRLALTASNLGLSAQTPGGAPASAAASAGASQPAAFDGLGDELDSVLEAADLICADADAVRPPRLPDPGTRAPALREPVRDPSRDRLSAGTSPCRCGVE